MERVFKEYTAIFSEEDALMGTDKEICALIMIDMLSVIAFNEDDKGNAVIDLQGGSRYRLTVTYETFKAYMYNYCQMI